MTNLEEDVAQVQAFENQGDSYAPAVGGKRRKRKSQKKSRKSKRVSKKSKSKSRKTKKSSKGLSGWIAHVKSFAKSHGIKYPQALKDPRCRKEYKN